MHPIAIIKSCWDTGMGVRVIYKDLVERHDARQDEQQLPEVVQWMDETEQKIRLEKNLHAYVSIFEDA